MVLAVDEKAVRGQAEGQEKQDKEEAGERLTFYHTIQSFNLCQTMSELKAFADNDFIMAQMSCVNSAGADLGLHVLIISGKNL